MTTQAPADRVRSLDGLRGLSILLVVLGHVAGTAGTPAWSGAFHQLGGWGVKFFFVISGFIITRLLVLEHEKHGRIALNGFWLRRAARILPAYLAYVLAIWLASSLGAISLAPADVLHALTFTMNYYDARSWYLNHTWSLSVEEQFYLVWPLAVITLGRLGTLRFALFVILAAPIARAVMWHVLDASPTAMTRALPATADALAAGAVLALASASGAFARFSARCCGRWGTLFWFAAAFAAPAAIFKLSPGAYYVAGQSVMVVAIALAIRGCVDHPQGLAGRMLNTRFLVWHGSISYSLYLWQEPFLNSFDTRWFAAFPLNLALAYAAALVSLRLIERPCRLAILKWGEAAAPQKPEWPR